MNKFAINSVAEVGFQDFKADAYGYGEGVDSFKEAAPDPELVQKMTNMLVHKTKLSKK